MKIVAMSDLHGFLPQIPNCDLLIFAGDLCPTSNHNVYFQQDWLDNDFRHYLNNIPAKKIIGVAGNHDFIFQEKPHLVPKGLKWEYLEDDWTTFEGKVIHGSPWTPIFHWWAFNASEKDLEERWNRIKDPTSILVTHGPPLGILDVNNQNIRCGSSSLKEITRTLPQLELHIFGHIHEGRGLWNRHRPKVTIFANVTVLNEKYENIYTPMEFTL
jgi:Icc-related predicted phosphoesterase